MARPNFTDEDLELLSEEERAGLLDDTLVDDDPSSPPEGAAEDDEAAAAAVEGQQKPTDPPAAEDPEPKPQDPPKPDAAPAEGAAPATEEKPTDPPPAAAPKPPAPASALPKYEADPEAKKKLTALESQQDALAQKFDDGEMTAAEFKAQDRALTRQINDLREQTFRASLSQDAQRHTWNTQTVSSFLAEHDEYQPGTIFYDALDLVVRRLQVGDYKDDPFNPEILAKAHEKVQQDLGSRSGKPVQQQQPGVRRDIPPNLGAAPAAEGPEIGDGGKFAHLDRLTGVAYEEALAKLSDEERNAYLAS